MIKKILLIILSLSLLSLTILFSLLEQENQYIFNEKKELNKKNSILKNSVQNILKFSSQENNLTFYSKKEGSKILLDYYYQLKNNIKCSIIKYPYIEKNQLNFDLSIETELNKYTKKIILDLLKIHFFQKEKFFLFIKDIQINQNHISLKLYLTLFLEDNK